MVKNGKSVFYFSFLLNRCNQWSVMTLSWAGHNRVHFQVEGSLWVEALCV